MERLTSNKSVSEMSMYELAHNSCYAKDGNARYRDYDADIDARWLAIKLLDKYADIPNEFSCEDDFDEFMMDSLQYGADSMLGMIAVFYRNIWAMSDLRERLKEYENLEEQGKLPRLPCAVGDTVYYRYDGIKIAPMCVKEISIMKCGAIILTLEYFGNDKKLKYWRIRIESAAFDNKIIFFTREEAEAALKDFRGKNG